MDHRERSMIQFKILLFFNQPEFRLLQKPNEKFEYNIFPFNLTRNIRTKKHISGSFEIGRNVIVPTVFLLLLNQTEFNSAHNQERKILTTIISISTKREKNSFVLLRTCFEFHRKRIIERDNL